MSNIDLERIAWTAYEQLGLLPAIVEHHPTRCVQLASRCPTAQTAHLNHNIQIQQNRVTKYRRIEIQSSMVADIYQKDS